MRNPVNLLRTEGQKKRRELTSLVKQVIEKEDAGKFRLEWDHGYLEKQLSIGYIVLVKDGNILSLYTLNKRKANYPDLEEFNAVDISIPKGNQKAKLIAYKICVELEEKGYHTKIRELK